MPRAPKQRIEMTSPEWPFREPLPFEPVVLRDLIITLDKALKMKFENNRLTSACDHTMNRSRAFLAQKGDVEAMIEWLGYNGAGCDCEVLLNVADKYVQAYGKVSIWG